MEDDFYESLNQQPGNSGLISNVFSSIIAAPLAVVTTFILAPLLIVIVTRVLSGRSSETVKGKDAKTVWILPYWMPVVGHAFQL